jgi:hypothetical protein
MATMPIVVDGHHWMKLELGRGSNQVEPGLTLDADRLQSKRVASTHEATAGKYRYNGYDKLMN